MRLLELGELGLALKNQSLLGAGEADGIRDEAAFSSLTPLGSLRLFRLGLALASPSSSPLARAAALLAVPALTVEHPCFTGFVFPGEVRHRVFDTEVGASLAPPKPTRSFVVLCGFLSVVKCRDSVFSSGSMRACHHLFICKFTPDDKQDHSIHFIGKKSYFEKFEKDMKAKLTNIFRTFFFWAHFRLVFSWRPS